MKSGGKLTSEEFNEIEFLVPKVVISSNKSLYKLGPFSVDEGDLQ